MNSIYQKKYLKYKKKYFKLQNQIGGEFVCKSNINNGLCDTILEAPNKCYVKMQDDGNLVVYDSENTPLWASNTNGKGIPPYKYILQGDGNLVIYDSENTPLWASNTDLKGISPYKIIIQEDCNFVLYDSTEKPLWASKSENNIRIPTIAENDRNTKSWLYMPLIYNNLNDIKVSFPQYFEKIFTDSIKEYMLNVHDNFDDLEEYKLNFIDFNTFNTNIKQILIDKQIFNRNDIIHQEDSNFHIPGNLQEDIIYFLPQNEYFFNICINNIIIKYENNIIRINQIF
jgi:hypothetical protein